MLFLTACQNENESKPVPLSAEESEVLEAIGDDLEIIDESDFADIVPELIAHVGQNVGKVIQLEGAYSSNDGSPFVYRILKNGNDETICALPLIFVEKDLPEDSWIRVSGIVNQDESDKKAVLEVIAVESLQKSGKRTLKWNGPAHQH